MKINNFYILLILHFILTSCIVDVPIVISTKKADTPFIFKILKDSRQIVLTQEYPWEAQAMLYFNVVKTDSIWHMWYKSYGITEKIDYVGYFCHAYSNDGEHWSKNMSFKYDENDSTNIILSRENIAIHDQFVYYDDKDNIYRMIAAKNNGTGKQVTTNILESENGINWVDKKIIYNKYYDTQFSLIRKNNNHYVYQREWYNGLRVIGISVLDENFNIIESPKMVLMSNDKNFPHVYNNAASMVNNTIIFFPTLYNKEKDTIKMTIGFEYNNEFFLTDSDITDDLYYGEKIEWGIVSPGLIPTDEPNTYWMYYYGTNYSHENVRNNADNISKYYRIKINIISNNSD